MPLAALLGLQICVPCPSLLPVHQAPLLVCAVTEYNVCAAAFCPFEPDAFMTAGRDSIRCYRLHHGELRGMSVRRTGGAGPLASSPASPGSQAPTKSSSAVVAAGHQRQKEQQLLLLPGTAPAGAAAGPNIFTVITYDSSVAAGQAARRFAFVGSASGCVFQVDYSRSVWAGVEVLLLLDD
jgi:hypothetical protein